MKKTFIFLTLLSSMFMSFAQTNAKSIPLTDLKTMDGKTFNSSKFSNEGKPMVIIVWESFCRPCLSYFDAINENFDDWKKETGVKIIIISIDPPKSSSNVAPLVKSKGWDFESYLDVNRDFKTAMGVTSCPHSFLVDGKGSVVWEKIGYSNGTESDLFELIKKLTKGQSIK